MSRFSMSSKKKISREFSVKFELKPNRKRIKQDGGEMPFDWFVKHFGQLEVAPRYKITVEVAK